VAFTAKLGTIDSRPGNIVPGLGSLLAAARAGSFVDTLQADGTWTAALTGTVTVECWGAGGGGTSTTGGGGGGAYAAKSVSVTLGLDYAIVVGQSGLNVNGGDSSFGGSTVVAKGGLSGGNGGTGGTAAASTGDTKYGGGDGTLGAGLQNGGGGAGDSAAGSGTTGGAPNGGYGGFNTGVFIAAGGGSNTGAARAGAPGLVRITYTAPGTPNYYPTVYGRSWGRGGTGSATVALTMPAGIVAGELLVAIFGSYLNVTHTPSAGWTKLGEQANGTTACVLSVHYKVAAGSDTLSITMSSARDHGYVVLRIKNAAAIEGTFATGTGAGDPPSHTYTGGATHILWLAAACYQDSTGATVQQNITAPPSGYSNLLGQPSNRAASTLAAYGAVAERITGGTDTENPGAFTATSNPFVTVTLAIPASAIGPVGEGSCEIVSSGVAVPAPLVDAQGHAGLTAVGVADFPRGPLWGHAALSAEADAADLRVGVIGAGACEIVSQGKVDLDVLTGLCEITSQGTAIGRLGAMATECIGGDGELEREQNYVF